MLRRIFRILFGFILACLAAAAVTVTFADIQLIRSMSAADTEVLLSTTGVRVLRLATIGALFSAPIAFVGIMFAEWRRIQDWAYYAVLALLIALLGFLAWYRAESIGGATIVNSFAMTAFLTSGFVGGLIYWLFSGHNAGKPYARQVGIDTFARTQSKGAASQAPRPKAEPVKAEPVKASPVKTEPVKASPAKAKSVIEDSAVPDIKKVTMSLSEKVEQAAQSADDLVAVAKEKVKAAVTGTKTLEGATKTADDLLDTAKDAFKSAGPGARTAEEAVTQGSKTAQTAAKTAEEAARKATSVPETIKDLKKE